MGGVAAHEHQWEIAAVATQRRHVMTPAALSDDEATVVAQAKILSRCTVAGCDATKTDTYEGPPEGVPHPPRVDPLANPFEGGA